ncbi:hypothetical protein BHX98_20545 [Acinetobacter baumannii]|nr:hypothetical protein BHX98_20545 [Acinetobacter baumannii]
MDAPMLQDDQHHLGQQHAEKNDHAAGLVTIRNANDSMVMLPSSRNEANIRSASMQACCAPAASRMGAKARPNWLPWPFSSGIASPRR